MTMQLKLNREKSLKQSLAKSVLKGVLFVVFILVILFLIEKINFPAPEKKINTDITNEIIKLK